MASQQDVITWVNNILPELNSSEDPEPVLLKFARSKNLPPAQLEKLAQVYNTAKANSFMDKNAENRAGLFSVVDPQALMAQYGKSLVSKAASIIKVAAASTAATSLQVMTVMPNLLREYDSPMEKASTGLISHIDDAHKKYCDAAEAMTGVEAMRKESAQVDQEAFEARLRVTQNIEKIADIIKERRIDFTTAHQDAWFDCGSNHNFEKLGKALNSGHFMNVKCAESSGPRRLMAPQDSELHGLMLRVVDDIDYAEAAAGVVEDYTSDIKIAQEANGIDTETDPEEKFANSLMAFVQDPVGEATTAKKQDNEEQASAPGGPDPNARRPSAVPEGSGLKTLTQAPKQQVSPSLKGLVPLPGFSQQDSSESYWDRQTSIDDVAMKTRHGAVLQGLLMNDDVLKDLGESDEEKVIDAFNLIARNAPTLAADPTSIRQHLRAVVEYGSLTPQDLDTIIGAEMSILDRKDNALKLDQKQREVAEGISLGKR